MSPTKSSAQSVLASIAVIPQVASDTALSRALMQDGTAKAAAGDTIETATEIDSIRRAIAQLAQGDFQSKWDSAKHFSKQFSEWGDRVITPLIKQLEKTAQPEDQWFLIRILSQYDRPDVVAAIAKLLATTPDEDLQIEATKALTKLGDSAIAALTPQLAAHHHQPQRVLAARALSHIRRSGVVDPLLSIAEDRDVELRAIAIEALGSFHDPRVTPVLLKALHDEPAICLDAVRTLGRRRDLLSDSATEGVSAVDIVSPLAACLQHSSEAVAKESAIALGRLGTEAATTALGNALTQPVATKAKVAAVRALGWMDTAAAVAYLVRAFDCSVPVVMPGVRQEIARSLGQTQSDALKHKAAEPLIAWLNATHQSAQQRLRQASSPSPVVNIAPDPEAFLLKQTVMFALAQLSAVEALDSLVPLLSDGDSRIRMHALSALKQIDLRAAQVKTQAYLDNRQVSPQHRQRAAESLLAW